MAKANEFFFRRLEDIFEMGSPTQAQIIDAYHKANELRGDEPYDYLLDKFNLIDEGLYKSKKKWLGAGTGDDKSLYLDNTNNNTLIYWVDNRGQEDCIYDGRNPKDQEEFEHLLEMLEIKRFLKWE